MTDVSKQEVLNKELFQKFIKKKVFFAVLGVLAVVAVVFLYFQYESQQYKKHMEQAKFLIQTGDFKGAYHEVEGIKSKTQEDGNIFRFLLALYYGDKNLSLMINAGDSYYKTYGDSVIKNSIQRLQDFDKNRETAVKYDEERISDGLEKKYVDLLNKKFNLSQEQIDKLKKLNLTELTSQAKVLADNNTSVQVNSKPAPSTKSTQIDIGMTDSQVKSILGTPDEVLNTPADSKGTVRFRWHYKDHGYLYFADNKVWQVTFSDYQK